MAGGTPNNETQQQANLQAAITEIRRLQAEVAEIQKEKADEIAKTAEEDNVEVSQPLAQQLWLQSDKDECSRRAKHRLHDQYMQLLL
jgi:phage host-nuclease inhibitor protein Gam